MNNYNIGTAGVHTHMKTNIYLKNYQLQILPIYQVGILLFCVVVLSIGR